MAPPSGFVVPFVLVKSFIPFNDGQEQDHRVRDRANQNIETISTYFQDQDRITAAFLFFENYKHQANNDGRILLTARGYRLHTERFA